MNIRYKKTFATGWAALEKRLMPSDVLTSDPLTFWRERILFLICFIAAVLGPIALVPSLLLAYKEGLWSVILIDSLAYMTIVIILIARNSSFVVRAMGFCSILYALGICILFILGPVGAGYLWLFGASVLISTFIGIGAAIWTLAVNAIVLLSVGIFIAYGNPAWIFHVDNALEKWLVMSANFLLLNALITITTAFLLNGLKTTLLIEQKISKNLQESENKYRLIAENMVDVITIADMNLRFTYVSPSITRIRRFTVEEAMAQTLEQAMTPESMMVLLREFEAEMQLEASGTADPNRTRILELEQYRKDGSTLWTENTFSFIRDRDQEPMGILALSRDITERRKADDALKKSEERFRIITGNMRDTIWMMDMNLKITYITPSVVHNLGYTIEELQTLPLKKSFTPDSWQSFRHLVADELTPERLGKKDLKIERTLEFELCRKDGSSFWSEITMTLIRETDGTPKGFVGVGRDISVRKKAEESLILSEEKFRKTVLTNPDSIVITRLADGAFVLVNQSFLKLSGYTEEEVIGKTSLDINLWENSNDKEKIFKKLSAQGSVKNFEARFRKKNGEVGSGLFSASIIDLEGLPHLLTITRDLTDRNRIREEKDKLEAQLQQSQKMEAIGTLAGGIAHDFNNILTAILGYTEIAISDLPQGSDTRGNLEEVFNASLRAIDLVQQILMFSRQSETQLFPIRIHLIIKEALKLLRASLPSTIEINQNIRALGTVLADLTQIHQIMMNLCTNASHAMSENGGELSVNLIQVNVPDDKTAPMDLPPGPYLKLTVSDTGCGMTPEVRNRIFEPYYTTKGIDKGTGLGLAVVHGIVQSHGGRITVESEPGKGSSFHVYLPEILDLSEDKETSPADAPDTGGTERILFVDDEATIVRMGKKMLEKMGYKVVAGNSGVEALELFRANPDQFDLVITDMTMPHMTGDQLSKQLIEIKPDIAIILCTGFSEKMTEEAAKEIGIREFIMKPVSRQVLSKIIRKVLDAPNI